MTFEERCYRTLVVSSSGKFNEILIPLLSSARCEPIIYTDSITAAKRFSLEQQFDFIIINSPLSDETGVKFAIDVSSGKSSVCLLFVKAEVYADTRNELTAYGVFTLPKPTSSAAVTHALSFLASARERLRTSEKKALSIEEKMEEIRLINRAKWVLINRLKMTEADAHRYIEKQAMDLCVSKSKVSKDILQTYI